MKWFLPRFTGTMNVGRIPENFFYRMADRVRDGLFVPGSRTRANYAATRSDRYELRFAAGDWWTAINVGLNQVRLFRVDGERIGYEVTYWKWTLYAVGLGALIGLSMIAGLFFVPLEQMEVTEWGRQGVLIFGINAGFWCFAWPWVLTAIHKRFAARCLENIMREELEGENNATGLAHV
jgi:uncharacterized membrane protein (DUF485 family)